MQDLIQSLDLHSSTNEPEAGEDRDLSLFIVAVSAERIYLEFFVLYYLRFHLNHTNSCEANSHLLKRFL
jgi:hypothetical protein